MSKKKIFISAVVLTLLAALVYLQIRTWQRFDWQKFWAVTKETSFAYLLLGTALIYIDYVLRALRWKILLRPVCQARTSQLVAPTLIGFTGLALLGRPGEFIRPYLIARRQGLSMSSQAAVWTVERIFDSGAFALMTSVNILIAGAQLKTLPGFVHAPKAFLEFQISGAVLLVGVATVALFAYLVKKNPERIADFMGRIPGRISEHAGQAVSHRVQAFGKGLNTIQDLKSFFQLCGLSLAIWLIIGFSYLAVIHAYQLHRHAAEMSFSNVLLLTAASVVGGVLQLPVVGGGSQLATIGVLHGVFAFSPELSTSCGMMLWLVTFMSVIPAGLSLTHREHVSLTRLEEESEAETMEGKALEARK